MPTALHVGSVLQEHVAVPAVPPHVWRAPQATGAAYAQQPFAPNVQVARPPAMHDVCPCVQLLEHVSEHPAFGARPEHDIGIVQDDVDAT